MAHVASTRMADLLFALESLAQDVLTIPVSGVSKEKMRNEE